MKNLIVFTNVIIKNKVKKVYYSIEDKDLRTFNKTKKISDIFIFTFLQFKIYNYILQISFVIIKHNYY